MYENNRIVERYSSGKFLPLYNFNKIKGDTILFVNDSGIYSCDTLFFVIDTIKPLTQNNNLSVQSGRFLINTSCTDPRIRFIPHISIVERMGIPKFNNIDEYFSMEPILYYERCYEDVAYNIHFINFSCDSIIDKVSEKLNPNLPVKIYPNPAAEKIQIEFSKSNNNSKTTIILYDIVGKLIKTIENNKPTSLFEINTMDLTNGLYYLKIIVDNEFVTKQIIVNH